MQLIKRKYWHQSRLHFCGKKTAVLPGSATHWLIAITPISTRPLRRLNSAISIAMSLKNIQAEQLQAKLNTPLKKNRYLFDPLRPHPNI
jgi:hypothetical protein